MWGKLFISVCCMIYTKIYWLCKKNKEILEIVVYWSRSWDFFSPKLFIVGELFYRRIIVKWRLLANRVYDTSEMPPSQKL